MVDTNLYDRKGDCCCNEADALKGLGARRFHDWKETERENEFEVKLSGTPAHRTDNDIRKVFFGICYAKRLPSWSWPGAMSDVRGN